MRCGMESRARRVLASALAIGAVLSFTVPAAVADRVEKTLDIPGGGPGAGSTRLTYQIITPDNFKPGSTAPVLLVLPPGPQDADMVNAGLSKVDPECRKQGWVVVSPEAPGGRLFYKGSEEYLPALLDEVKKTAVFEGGRVHMMGSSNGGLSALRFAIARPELVRSVILLPGGFASKEDAARIDRLKHIPVRLFVGSDDNVGWTDGAKDVLAAGEKAGLNITLDIRQAQGHMIANLMGEELMRLLDGFRTLEGTMTGPKAEVAKVLDTIHEAAANAEFDRYFAQFAADGIFIGTDATERWTIDQFKAYAKPIFDKGKGKGGWTYTVRSRNVDLFPDGQAAWFDEVLDNAKYGECRGTGVLRKVGAKWVICQYHLTVPVPNPLLERVAKMIKAEKDKEKRK